ncbi:MAG: hypothetical protein ACJAQT_002338 [Akkermansiaceae bacterium]|jgi:hypothetical protein
MATAFMTELEAADTTTDSETLFVHDDNNPPTNSFENGEVFYYFAAAHDIAGYSGAISKGTRVIICDRLPFTAPSIESVTNVYKTGSTADLYELKGNQHLRIHIRQNSGLPKKDAAKRYDIYQSLEVGNSQAGAGPFFALPLPDPDTHLSAILMGAFSSIEGPTFISHTANPLLFFFTVCEQNIHPIAPESRKIIHLQFLLHRSRSQGRVDFTVSSLPPRPASGDLRRPRALLRIQRISEPPSCPRHRGQSLRRGMAFWESTTPAS